MFDSGYKSQYMGSQQDKLYRLEVFDSRLSSSTDAGVKKSGFSIDKLSNNGHGSCTTSRSFKRGMRKGSEGLKSIGRSLGFGVSKAVFPEDLKVSEKKIFDPQDKFLLLWNKLSLISCILAVSVDPLFFYLPVIDDQAHCVGIDRKLSVIATTLRTVIDAFYLIHMALQFRTAYIAPSSRVFGRGELVIDPAQIAKRYLRRYFIIDFLSVFPLPQIVIVGAFWYLLAIERNDFCWQKACSNVCNKNFLYCGNQYMEGYAAWQNISANTLKDNCAADGDNPPFDYGIFGQALTSDIVSSSKNFVSKYCYCLWWGLQNLSTLGQGLQTSTYPGEVIFSIALAIAGLILFALLIGNMQTYLQSLTIRLEEMRVKRRDSEQWMHHRLLPQDLRERVRRYDQYKWLATRGVDEEHLVQSLPKDLRRDIKRHLCLALVRRVPLFESMDERLLDAICERLKPCLFTENTYIVREGDPVDEMLFIIRGRLESVTTDGGRSGFFNRGFLKEADFCGEELLTWALDPRSGSNLPTSTRTVKALTEVEAFALTADELKFVASQFRRLHSRQVQHTFRFYSQQWRTWAACFIQAAWRRYSKKKIMKLRQKEDPDESEGAQNTAGGTSYSLGAALLASKFAAHTLRGVQRNRNARTARELVKLQKPPEPDFTADDAD
ncbi:putative cyclic nucleotide-gated ion channel 5 [Stylosanthes scabra]|uniref:Cyclic nucleotide-gated ion channel 5 n=1 Tax=Stylosanthes scabra TaxID=79078 RepID=A0ABU6TFN4_9FABA|nr:putative cyclic nucleotide-gated ion channel 5 [Stylosanthes scabra]